MIRKHAPTAADLHRGWLELVDTDGPFLAVPALRRVWPQGMPQLERNALAALKDAKPAFEKAWENWDKQPGDAALDLYRQARDTWVDVVVRDILGWGDTYRTDTGIASVRSPNHAVTVQPNGALVHGDLTGALVLITDPVDSLRDPLNDGWAATPIDRMEELLRTAKVPIGVVTDGRWWAIVSAREKTMVASGIVDAQTWIEEPQTRNAFIELLQRRRLVGGKPQDRLTELFGQSVAAAEEVTEALGTQVRRAVELLVQALSEAALDADPDPLPDNRAHVYEAAVTVMMRVVFLLFAEERGLLPQGRLFAAGYGVSGELDALDARAREEGTEALDATYLTWHRLLATSQALFHGSSFEDIRLPSYGGSLFDPSRFPFLTARNDRGTLAITVSDRVMLEVLDAVQVAKLKGQPARRISFRDIDVEQIGYIYEGLLGYSSTQVDEVVVGLIGKEGEEPEIPLAQLETLAAETQTDAALSDSILAWVKENQPAATAPSKSALKKAIRDSAKVEDAERALRAVTTDEHLRDRLRPFIGILRRDLRNRPLVVVPGGVLVVETPSRATAGAHYTPRALAEEVVHYALEPLVYDPGPHQQVDGWVPVSSDRILDLKVADIACGSGAFLVAAARFLAARLVEAWRSEGVAVGTPHEQQTHAIRTIVATCLYGADINVMAVEMCKLSLWLVSLDPKLPFSFVDDKILHGNALLGLTNARQLKHKHINPDTAPHQPSLLDLDIDGILRKAARLRQKLATEVDDSDPQRSATTKRRQWRDYQQLTAQLTDIADAVVATGLRLGGKPGRALREAYENLLIAIEQAYPGSGGTPDRTVLDKILDAGLTPTVETDYERWKPLHWILAVPDVMERGGFDAIVGNPPFLGGQKLTGTTGTNIRDWFVNVLANGTRGSADLVGYFLLRAVSLLTENGNLGLIATNSVWQGATRRIGLDRMVASGFTITRAIQSESWPAASANLEYAAAWGTRRPVPTDLPRIADGIAVHRISSFLEAVGRVDGAVTRLTENVGISYQGCIVLGMGFVLEPHEAEAWIATNPANSDVLIPYLSGEDLNSRFDLSASRWVIDFTGRCEICASKFSEPFDRVRERVLPERAKKAKPVREAPWWTFLRPRPAMRKAIAGLREVLVIARVSKTVMPARVANDRVFHEKVVVFATDSHSDQAVLSSSLHQLWAIKHGTTMRIDPTYTPSTCFDTFPRPEQSDRLDEIGLRLDVVRREIQTRREVGLTELYGLVNDPDTPDSADRDVARLREIHIELDHAVMDAYGWNNVALDHGFHTWRQMTRWTVSPEARVEILDRLLEENHRRAAAQGEAPSPAEDEDEERGEE
ncbi:Eco57I restriction-modification methylase domain-containing protein [Micromonospora sp. LOL_023]|uniref:Eco57I restriction-modification methylase domain-containing protein n=1 Tax=Micromonospora sp. LOL_023 TaxID=3345418 RepID=UPI003A843444